MKRLGWMGLLAWLAACTHIPSTQERTDTAALLAGKAGWKHELIATDDFDLLSYKPGTTRETLLLTIYIEGDGLAWINATTPSLDPTPVNPLALKLALLDKEPSAYLARPCQYVSGQNRRNCSAKFWTSHRFASEVIHATNQAIDKLKAEVGAQKLILVGYSGGGAVAALVAAQRRDISRLITIAGNLDHATWTRLHHVTPLTGSLNPADLWERLQSIPQTHFAGAKDAVIEEHITRAYTKNFAPNPQIQVIVIPNFDHHCCWEQRWPALKETTLH